MPLKMAMPRLARSREIGRRLAGADDRDTVLRDEADISAIPQYRRWIVDLAQAVRVGRIVVRKEVAACSVEADDFFLRQRASPALCNEGRRWSGHAEAFELSQVGRKEIARRAQPRDGLHRPRLADAGGQHQRHPCEAVFGVLWRWGEFARDALHGFLSTAIY